ncbi:MAG: hypothetical protein IJC63_03535, partial [Myxococcaceae bacterium]|nr:hypothetical protein [Myxococcaceae bacterium]
FFLLLPTLAAGKASLPVLLIALLLIGLLVPYTLVYFGYENRVRAMAIGRMRLWEARSRRREAQNANTAARESGVADTAGRESGEPTPDAQP